MVRRQKGQFRFVPYGWPFLFQSKYPTDDHSHHACKKTRIDFEAVMVRNKQSRSHQDPCHQKSNPQISSGSVVIMKRKKDGKCDKAAGRYRMHADLKINIAEPRKAHGCKISKKKMNGGPWIADVIEHMPHPEIKNHGERIWDDSLFRSLQLHGVCKQS